MASSLASRLSHTLSNSPQPLLCLVSASILGAACYSVLRTFTKNNKESSIPATLATSKTQPCFFVDTGISAVLTLPDGRRLGYAQYGSLTGRPVFYAHGLPGSRIEGGYFHEIGLKLDARIIAVDRPGMGWSSPQPKRTVLDYPKDIERLAEHLGLNEYCVIGVSGGGPYTLACAAALPRDKLKAAAIVCGMGPPDIPKTGMKWMYWAGFAFGWRYFPGICRRYFEKSIICQQDMPDEKRVEIHRQQFLDSNPDERDVEIVKNDEEGLFRFMRSTREFFVQGWDGVLQDGKLISSDFGFRIEDIRADLPVSLWYGKRDNNVPPIFGEYIVARLGAGAHLRIEDETHGSIFFNWRTEVLKDLLARM